MPVSKDGAKVAQTQTVSGCLRESACPVKYEVHFTGAANMINRLSNQIKTQLFVAASWLSKFTQDFVCISFKLGVCFLKLIHTRR